MGALGCTSLVPQLGGRSEAGDSTRLPLARRHRGSTRPGTTTLEPHVRGAS